MAGKKESAVIVGDARQKWFVRKRLVLPILVIVIVVAVGIIGGVLWHNHQLKAAQDNQREALVTQAAQYLDAQSLEQLAPFVPQIKQQPGYLKDVNSLYVLTIYYLNATDPQNSKTYYNDLTKLYNAKTGYTNKSLKGAKTPAQLNAYYTTVENYTFYTGKLPGSPAAP